MVPWVNFRPMPCFRHADSNLFDYLIALEIQPFASDHKASVCPGDLMNRRQILRVIVVR